MENNYFKKRNGKSPEIVRLDIHNWLGELLHRTKGKTTEPIIGVMMIETIKDIFNLKDEDIQILRHMEFRRSIKEQEALLRDNSINQKGGKV